MVRKSATHAEPLAKVFEGFVLVDENHAAREDTIIFPAWRKNSSTNSSMKSPITSKISSAKCSGRGFRAVYSASATEGLAKKGMSSTHGIRRLD
jgi:hypothetical protein